MTNLTYDVLVNGVAVTNVKTYAEAKAQVAQLGRGASYKAVYTSFNPEETAETRSKLRKHSVKAAEKRDRERR